MLAVYLVMALKYDHLDDSAIQSTFVNNQMHSDCNDQFSDKNISDGRLVGGNNGAQNAATD